MTESAAKLSKCDQVWSWLKSLSKLHADYILQDLPRWVDDHPSHFRTNEDAFNFFWTNRQEFRSIIRYRVHNCSREFNLIKNGFDSATSGINWMFVQNLYLACSDIGPGLYIEHGFSTVVYAKRIGKNFRVNQMVTVGTNKGGCPVIGDNVQISTHAVVVGNIKVGNNVRVGAGAVVISTIPDNCTVVPQKSRIIQR